MKVRKTYYDPAPILSANYKIWYTLASQSSTFNIHIFFASCCHTPQLVVMFSTELLWVTLYYFLRSIQYINYLLTLSCNNVEF